MKQALITWTRVEDAPDALRDKFYTLLRNSTQPSSRFQDLLDTADPRIGTLINKNGLNLFDHLTSAACGTSDGRTENLANARLVMNKWPHSLNHGTVSHRGPFVRSSGSDPWSQYYLLKKFYRDGDISKDILDPWLDDLVRICHLPTDDQTMLEQMKASTFDHHMLNYACFNNFPESIAYGLPMASPAYLDDLANKELFPDLDQQLVLDAMDAYADHELSREEILHFMPDNSCLDMVRDFADRIVIPTLILMMLDGKPCTPDNLASIPQPPSGSDIQLCLYTAIPERWLQQDKPVSRMRANMQQLSRSWHHDTNRFALQEIGAASDTKSVQTERPKTEWYPLIPDHYITKNGRFRIRSYTCPEELLHAHKELGHCINSYSYTADCKRGLKHIIAIESAIDGKVLSTADVRLQAQGSIPSGSYVPLDGRNLVVVQHEAAQIHGAAHRITAGPLHDALHEWMWQASQGKVPVNTEKTGMTDELKAWEKAYSNNSTYDHMVKMIGYVPNPTNLDRAFQEFKKDLRRGSTGIDAEGRLIYAPDACHLIDGTVDVDGKKLSLRDMNAREWLHASDLLPFLIAELDGYREYLDVLLEEMRRPITASLPAPLNSDQIAHAINAGTLPRSHLHRLSAQERATFEQRTAQSGNPYFARST
jgi:hypothetical protein